MTYTYTPQAGDVIESPSGRNRMRVHSSDSDLSVYVITYRRKWLFFGPWTVSFWFGFYRTSTYILDNLVTDHGWKIVARRGKE